MDAIRALCSESSDRSVVLRAIRAVLHSDEVSAPPVPKTPYERMDFEKEWDARVRANQPQPQQQRAALVSRLLRRDVPWHDLPVSRLPG